jgi:hypothetical protein
MPASQAGRRGFDPRLPLHLFSGLQTIRDLLASANALIALTLVCKPLIPENCSKRMPADHAGILYIYRRDIEGDLRQFGGRRLGTPADGSSFSLPVERLEWRRRTSVDTPNSSLRDTQDDGGRTQFSSKDRTRTRREAMLDGIQFPRTGLNVLVVSPVLISQADCGRISKSRQQALDLFGPFMVLSPTLTGRKAIFVCCYSWRGATSGSIRLALGLG